MDSVCPIQTGKLFHKNGAKTLKIFSSMIVTHKI